MSYEVLYYEFGREDPVFFSFKTRSQAMKFYNSHKNDSDKTSWWITKRDSDGEILEDIIY